MEKYQITSDVHSPIHLFKVKTRINYLWLAEGTRTAEIIILFPWITIASPIIAWVNNQAYLKYIE